MGRHVAWVVLGIWVGSLACRGSVTLPERPRFKVVWPQPERYPDSVLVASGTVLTVAGYVYFPFYTKWTTARVFVQGRLVGEARPEAPGLVPRWDFDQERITFRVLVTDFGAIGVQDLVVQVCGEACGEVHIPIRNDPALLEQKARAYARRYWSIVADGRDYGTIRLVGNVISVVNTYPDPRIDEVLPEVLRWWELWCGGSLRFVPGGMDVPRIDIVPGRSTGALPMPPWPGAVTANIFMGHNENKDTDLFHVLLHEMGHALGIIGPGGCNPYTEEDCTHPYGYGSIMSSGPIEVGLQFNPLEQRACRLVYSHPPGTYF
ncbi:hypothetical protein HRbin11_02177 [bacterium HR11]|nr:hypothetical protein HRbin11_02177 [bacterium HR11]